jgi:hypothetical protein
MNRGLTAPAKNSQARVEETALSLHNGSQLARVQPHTLATWADVDLHRVARLRCQLLAAFRAVHPVQFLQAELFRLGLRLLLLLQPRHPSLHGQRIGNSVSFFPPQHSTINYQPPRGRPTDHFLLLTDHRPPRSPAPSRALDPPRPGAILLPLPAPFSMKTHRNCIHRSTNPYCPKIRARLCHRMTNTGRGGWRLC